MNINGYFMSNSLPEALGLMEENRGSARLIAGGTDIVVNAKRGKVGACCLIDITRIDELRNIYVDDNNSLHIGACATFNEILENPLVLERAPVLAEAAGKVGSVQIRNMGTIGGNIANASPSAETAPPLLVLGVSVVVAGPGGDRVIPIAEFFKGPGQTCLDETEIIKEFVIPYQADACLAYVKHGRRRAMDVATVNCAAKLVVDKQSGVIQKAAVAMGAVAPTPVLLSDVADMLQGTKAEDELFPELYNLAFKAVSPIADVRSSLEYRRQMISVVLKNTIVEAYKKAKETP